ncbi:IclR family transcriptional regulator C-terminal domain-containing protein [uncultured Cohaesibacter sp.]|uniref:IclR family transcriptional regulator n=1 Tax=uncultured Cohaesibacter sp. TaxID=1002546 RepID=UPI0029C8A482|nr:IclR family transcriptional regulator C-terminal domain-containing protein [uncultured Cohaesibacter sp.]
MKQLQQVCDRVGYTGYITVFDGYDLTILQVIRGKNPLAITRIPAYKTIAYSTSNGRAMLSMLSEEEWKKRIPDPMPYISPRTPSNHEELSQALEKIRQTGRSFATEESLAGIASVGIAIRDPDTTEIFGAAISFPANLVTEQERETIAELMDKMKSNLAGIKGIFE